MQPRTSGTDRPSGTCGRRNSGQRCRRSGIARQFESDRPRPAAVFDWRCSIVRAAAASSSAGSAIDAEVAAVAVQHALNEEVPTDEDMPRHALAELAERAGDPHRLLDRRACDSSGSSACRESRWRTTPDTASARGARRSSGRPGTERGGDQGVARRTELRLPDVLRPRWAGSRPTTMRMMRFSPFSISNGPNSWRSPRRRVVSITNPPTKLSRVPRLSGLIW